jgi:hypothetical protein
MLFTGWIPHGLVDDRRMAGFLIKCQDRKQLGFVSLYFVQG